MVGGDTVDRLGSNKRGWCVLLLPRKCDRSVELGVATGGKPETPAPKELKSSDNAGDCSNDYSRWLTSTFADVTSVTGPM